MSDERVDALVAEVQRLSAIVAQLQPVSSTNSSSPSRFYERTPLDVMWGLATTFIIFMMQIGFGMLEAGTVRAKNTKSILMKNLMDSCLSAIIWWAIGCSLAVRQPSPSCPLGWPARASWPDRQLRGHLHATVDSSSGRFHAIALQP